MSFPNKSHLMSKKFGQKSLEYIDDIVGNVVSGHHYCNLPNDVHFHAEGDGYCVVDSYLFVVPNGDHFSMEPQNHSYSPNTLLLVLLSVIVFGCQRDWSSSTQRAEYMIIIIIIITMIFWFFIIEILKMYTWTLYKLFELMSDLLSIILWYSSLSIRHNLIFVNILHRRWISSLKLHKLILK